MAVGSHTTLEVESLDSDQRKDDLAKEYLAEFSDREGILFIGKAQEKAYVVRTITKKHPETGRDYP